MLGGSEEHEEPKEHEKAGEYEEHGNEEPDHEKPGLSDLPAAAGPALYISLISSSYCLYHG